jgi:hypothetical protein
VPRHRVARPLLARGGRFAEARRRHAPGVGGGAQPEGRALRAQGERRRDSPRAALLQHPRGLREEGLREQEFRARPDRRQLGGAARWQEAHGADAEGGEVPPHLVLDDLRERPDHQQRARRVRRFLR